MLAKNTLSGGGTMGQRVLTHDWSLSPPGPASAWPQSFRTALNIMLGSALPTCVAGNSSPQTELLIRRERQ